MKITFTLGSIGLSGGVKAIFEFANQLHSRGHDVTIACSITPLRINAKWKQPGKLAAEMIARVLEYVRGCTWMQVDANLVFVPVVSDRFIPDADIVVATWWETAYPVHSLRKSKGEKFFLIQHYETWGGFKEDVDRSYSLGLHNIVNSTWLKNILEKDLRASVDALITHAPDWDHFYWEGKPRADSEIRVLMPYRQEKWKGVSDGLHAFNAARKEFGNAKLIMFAPVAGIDIPDYVEYHRYPSNEELRALYNSSHIFLFPSLFEGFGMPPMEAMACKAAVVTTNVGAVPEYTIPGKTALVSPPGEPELLAANLVKLIKEPATRERIANAGYEYVKQFTWEKAAIDIEKVFQESLARQK